MSQILHRTYYNKITCCYMNLNFNYVFCILAVAKSDNLRDKSTKVSEKMRMGSRAQVEKLFLVRIGILSFLLKEKRNRCSFIDHSSKMREFTSKSPL